jgi:3-isopropylmalate dehydrogenase
MDLKITVLPGDGVGPEVTLEAVRVLKEIASLENHRFTFEEMPAGGVAIDQSGTPLPDHTLKSCLSSKAVLLGAVGGPKYDNLPTDKRPEAGLLALRKALGGFANLRPAISYGPIVDCSPIRSEIVGGTNILIVRELLGGLYFGEPRGFADDARDSAFNTMRYSVAEVERVSHIAFKAAVKRGKRLTSVDKSNVLETSQLWRETVTRISKDYPEVTLEHLYVDACAMHLINNPKRFDVILTENLFGDILSDEAAVITGSLGMLASATIGGAIDLYEPVHGSAPDIAGKGIANPIGAVASAAMLLRYSAGLENEALIVEEAIGQVLEQGHKTADLLRGSSKAVTSTEQMGDLIISAVRKIVEQRPQYKTV